MDRDETASIDRRYALTTLVVYLVGVLAILLTSGWFSPGRRQPGGPVRPSGDVGMSASK